MTTSCPQGHLNEQASRFCAVCGTALAPTPEPTIEDSIPAPPDPAEPGPPAPDPDDPTAPTAVVSVMPSAAQPPPSASRAWIASHRTPPEGLDVRVDPSPQLPAVTRLPAGTQLAIEEWRGAWARVSIPSGWGGWVDGNRLVDISAPSATHMQQVSAPPGAIATPAPQPGWASPHGGGAATPSAAGPGPVVVLVGAATALGSTFLPWLGWGIAGVKAYDIPFAFLWSSNPQPSGFSIGVAAAILTGLVLLVAALMATGGAPQSAAGLVSFGGGLFAALSFAFVFQVIRTAMDFGIPLADILTDSFGIGAWMALGGAIAIGVGARLRPR